MKKITWIFFFLLFYSVVQAQSIGSIEAINEPDKFAWDIFMEINIPADITKGRAIPSATKPLGSDGITVWETWKLARNVFPKNGCSPTDWENWDDEQPKDPLRIRRNLEPTKAQLALGLRNEKNHILIDPARPLGNETRMNKSAYDFIVQNNLFTIEGQELFHEESKIIDLPVSAREIKGAWRELTEKEVASKKFHVAVIDNKTYGLTGLHIITKDLPQWFWATFEHIDNPTPETSGLIYFDRYTNGGNNLPQKILQTKWQNYRLRGTQTSFTDLIGRNTLLSNTQIEQGFQATSSCVSCHAHATIGPKISKEANRLPIFPRLNTDFLYPLNPDEKRKSLQLFGWVGIPNPKSFVDLTTGKKKYTQTDFMWSFFRASRKGTSCK